MTPSVKQTDFLGAMSKTVQKKDLLSQKELNTTIICLKFFNLFLKDCNERTCMASQLSSLHIFDPRNANVYQISLDQEIIS